MEHQLGSVIGKYYQQSILLFLFSEIGHIPVTWN